MSAPPSTSSRPPHTDERAPDAGVARAAEAPNAATGVARKQYFGLSLTQLVGTGLAATTATVAASFLGITGTVLGAALASVLTAIGNGVYTQSLRRGQARVRAAVPLAARPGRVVPADPGPTVEEPPAAGVAGPIVPSPGAADPGVASPGAADPGAAIPGAANPVAAGSPSWRRLLAVSGGIFLAVLAAVTVVELALGRPLSEALRGDSGSGTSFFGHTDRPAAPTVTVTVTPSVVVTTPVITQTAPARTQTVPATGTSTGTSGEPSTSAPTSTSDSGGSSTSTSPSTSAPPTADSTSGR